MAGDPRPMTLLRRHFFRRFFENDLLSGNGDGHERVTFLWAVAALPGMAACALLVFKYFNPLIPAAQRLLVAIPDKHLIVAYAMLTMALLAFLEWDALELDARDRLVLGPLPLPAAVLLRAKLAALAQFAGLFGLAVNAVSAIAYPALLLGNLPVGMAAASIVFSAHAIACFLATSFAFLAVLALRSALPVLLGRRLFGAVSLSVQLTGICAIVGALLVVPALPNRTALDLLRSEGPLSRFTPTMWFVGLYENLGSAAILADPRTAGESPRGFWSAHAEASHRKTYQRLQPALSALGRSSLWAVLASAMTALTFFILSSRRGTGSAAAGEATPAAGRATRILARLVSGHPVTQAAFLFTFHVVLRSPLHRLHVATYAAAGLAAAIVMLGPRLMAFAPGPGTPPVPVLAVQMVISFFVLLGLRAAFLTAAVPQARWAFEVCWTASSRRYEAGIRRATATMLAAVFLALFPVHVFWLGWRLAVVHAAAGWLAALVAGEWIVIRSHHVPFVSGFVQSRNPATSVFLGMLAFLFYAFEFTSLEQWTLTTASGPAWLLGSLTALLAAPVAWRSLRAGKEDVSTLGFQDQPAAATLGLNP